MREHGDMIRVWESYQNILWFGSDILRLKKMIKDIEDTKMKYYLKRVFNMNINCNGNATDTYYKIYKWF